MNKVLSLALCLPLAACVVGDSGTPAGGGDDQGSGSDPGSGSNPGSGTTPTGLSGPITSNTTWTGAVAIGGAVTINAGVTVTVAPGAVITVTGPSSAITVNGILDASGGTKAAPITFTGTWGGVDIESGGAIKYSYVTQTGGGIHMDDATAAATIMDSQLSSAAGDFLTMTGGTLDIEYSTLGVEAPAINTTHCNLHFNSTTAVTFKNNNNVNAPFGLMFYGGTGTFTHNNWISTKAAPASQVDIEPANAGTGDFSDSYFSNGVPSGTVGLTFNNPSATRLTDCGPR